MTEAEIMKALECCSVLVNCKGCYFDTHEIDGICGSELIKKAIDLINRKNAEIERLTINMNSFGLGMKREKERADTARAEAIKEVLERLKQEDGERNHIFDDCASILVSKEYRQGRYEKAKEFWETIDQIAKEMGCGE